MTPTTASQPLAERRTFVKDTYEHLWGGVYEKALQVVESGETDLGRVHLFMRRNFGPEFSDAKLKEKYRNHEKSKVESGYIVDKQLLSINDLDSRTVTLMTDAIKMREVIGALDPDIARIADLGSGWAKTLLNIFRYGGPRDAEYWSFELTEAGRRAAQLIVDTCAPNMSFRTHAFDYYDPDFSALARDPKPTCFVSHHSIEQIPEMPVSFIETLLATPGFRQCVHIEPCGWQIPTNNWLADDGKGKLRERMVAIDTANRDFSLRKNQNRNLYPVLRDLEKKGIVRMRIVRKYLVSHLMNNATTLIVWEKGNGVIPDSQLVNPRRDDLLPE
jgi:hypothetical protein